MIIKSLITIQAYRKALCEVHNPTTIWNHQYRALIFQGGGALGAYEAGVFKSLYYKPFDISKEEKLFDIVAGTSAGAINATLLVNYVKKNGNWEGSAELLCQFWEDVSTDTWLYENPFVTGLLDASSSFRDSYNIFWQNGFKKFDEYSSNMRDKSTLFAPILLFVAGQVRGIASNESFRR